MPDPAVMANLLVELTNRANQANTYHRAPKLTSDKPEDWRNFRELFEGAIAINRWTNQRARRELNTAIDGKPRLSIRGIPIGDGVAVGAADSEPPNLLLDQFERRLCPTVARTRDEHLARSAVQTETQTLTQWSVYYLDLYTKAYPDQAADAITVRGSVQAMRPLILNFIGGIKDPSIRSRV